MMIKWGAKMNVEVWWWMLRNVKYRMLKNIRNNDNNAHD